jgi:DNA adenine methylase
MTRGGGTPCASAAGDCRVLDVIRELALQYLSDVAPRRQLFYYPGSDAKLVGTLLKLFVQSGASYFVEVFGGSGVVTCNVARSGAFKAVVYNDADDLLTDVFLAVKDAPQEVAWRLLTLPCSRRYHQRVARAIKTGEIRYWTRLDRAAAVIFYHHMSYVGAANRTSSFFGARIRQNGTINARCDGLAAVAATVLEWAVVWRSVVVENLDFRDAVRKYDSEKTLLYLDPPYIAERWGRYYRRQFEHRDMQDLLELLRNVKGRWVLKLTDRNLKYDYVREFAKNYSVEKTDVRVTNRRRDEGYVVLIHNMSHTLEPWLKPTPDRS